MTLMPVSKISVAGFCSAKLGALRWMGQCGDGTAAQIVAHPAGALQQTGVQIEHVAGVSLTSRGTADQQRQGTVGHGVLGQVIVDDQDMLALMHEILAHGTAGVGCDILQGRQLGRCSGHHDGVAHGTGFGQALHKVATVERF